MGKESCESVLELPSFRPLTAAEFREFGRLAYRKFGLDLRQGKEELVSARIGKKLRELGLKSFRDYLAMVEADPSGASLVALIDALTTNHTGFLREPAHFEFLSKAILADLAAAGRLRIWSAACSSGEEPYSIAFTLLEAAAARGAAARADFSILASDISTRVLETARRAVYPAERFQGFPQPLLRKYCLLGEGRWRGHYRVRPEVRSRVEFERLNLIEPFPARTPFHVIFCRNVMIYFDKPTQHNLVNRLAECLEPGGYLLVGHAESLSGMDHPLVYLRPAIYRKPERGETLGGRVRGRR